MHFPRLLAAAALLAPLYAGDPVLVADTHTNSAFPALNFGTNTFLNVGAVNTALLRFDLSTLPPGLTAAQLESAHLVFFVNRLPAPSTLNLALANAPWLESTVSFSTLPAASAPFA